MSERTDKLLARLHKGLNKTREVFDSLRPAQWKMVLYKNPDWTVRDLLAHFVSTEEGLLRLAQDVAAGGLGAPANFDYDDFNAAEQERLAGIPREGLRRDLIAARKRTIAWVKGLDGKELDRTGRHPALGEISVETFINAIHGHQLMHIRDLRRLLN